jgi:predicted GIY-YIG superfamily endonuclease
MTQGIYAITNKLSTKVYIGSSKDIEKRFHQHKQLLARGKHHQFNVTAEKLGRDRENVRQAVAKVERKLGIKERSAQ